MIFEYTKVLDWIRFLVDLDWKVMKMIKDLKVFQKIIWIGRSWYYNNWNRKCFWVLLVWQGSWIDIVLEHLKCYVYGFQLRNTGCLLLYEMKQLYKLQIGPFFFWILLNVFVKLTGYTPVGSIDKSLFIWI